MKKTRRLSGFVKVLIAITINFIVLFSLGSVAKADDYPNRPITLEVGVAAGGATDQVMRIITPVMEKVLKTPIVIIYKAGGGGTVGASWLSTQKPDGYTIGTFSNSLFLQQFGKTAGVKIDKFDFITNVIYTDGTLTVRADSPFKTLQDLLDYAKKNPEVVTISNSGAGAIWHLLAAAIEQKAGVKFTHVPMTGESTSFMAMLGGHVSAVAVSLGMANKYLEAGQARVLGLATETRMPSHPNVPTLIEQGIDIKYGGYVGLLGPKGIPENRIKILSDAAEKACQLDSFKKITQTLGNRDLYIPYTKMNELAKIESEKLRNLLKLVGLHNE